VLRSIIPLIGFSLLILASQIVWVTFAPVASSVAVELGVSKWHIGLLATLFPIIYVVLAVPSGRMLDTRFRQAIILGSILIGFSGIARLASPYDYDWIFVCQLLGAIGQPFVVNGIAPFASRYFGEDKRPMAVGLSSASMYLGIIMGMALGEPLYSRGGLWLLQLIPAMISGIAVLWVVVTTIAYPPVENVETLSGHLLTTFSALKGLASRRDLWLLSVLLGMGLGVFDILVSWLEPVLSTVGIGGIAGDALAVMITSGIAGASVMPSIASKLNARTTMLRLIGLSVIIVYIVLSVTWEPTLILAVFAVHGFLLLSGFPLIIDWIEAKLPIRLQGQATGFVMLVSHILAVTTLMPAGSLIGSPLKFYGFIVILGMIAFAGTLMLPSNEQA